MDGACVPWEATAALPKFDKPLPLALVAPDASVQVVVVECLLGACQLMRALWASEEDYLRQWWCDWFGRYSGWVDVSVGLWWLVWYAGVVVHRKPVWLDAGRPSSSAPELHVFGWHAVVLLDGCPGFGARDPML